MNTRTLYTFICVSFFVAGCASSPEVQISSLNSTTICCQTYVDIPIHTALNGDHTFDISGDSPVFLLPSGRSHFSAFTLPAEYGGKSLMLRTFAGAATISNGGGAHVYFYPAVTFLNASREYLSTQHDEKPIAELYGWSGHGSFVGKVNIPKGAAFAIFHTITSKVGASYVGYTRGPGFTTMAGGALISLGGGVGPMRAVFSTTGKIMVSITP